MWRTLGLLGLEHELVVELELSPALAVRLSQQSERESHIFLQAHLLHP